MEELSPERRKMEEASSSSNIERSNLASELRSLSSSPSVCGNANHTPTVYGSPAVKKASMGDGRSKEDLPQELVSLVISKLAIKNIFKNKCLSKHWKKHIESPHFDFHPTSSLVFHRYNKTQQPEVTFFKVFDGIQGPGVTTYFPRRLDEDGKQNQFYLWNSLERKYLDISPPSYDHEASISYGFGWNLNDGCKIIRMRQHFREDCSRWDVFLGSTRSWYEGQPFNVDVPVRFDGSEFFNGNLYWIIALIKPQLPGQSSSRCILCCELSSLTFTHLSCPTLGNIREFSIKDGRLCISSTYVNNVSNLMESALLAYNLRTHTTEVIFEFVRGEPFWQGLVHAPTTVALEHACELVGDAELKSIPVNYLKKKLIKKCRDIVKVVLRANLSGAIYDKVAIISGGGSGHEPAHAGFVGEGMLTLATDEGYKVEVVIVGDDCAQQPPRGISGRRGSDGTILVHKIAGAAAASGLYLEEVVAEAKRASDMVWTMGVTFSLCTVPGQLNPDYILPSKFELGIGIHGEPGLIRPLSSRLGSKLVSDILKEILSTENVTITSDSKVVVVING
ncbi:hypothetical protein OROHE_015681 [Orobanche hederae]